MANNNPSRTRLVLGFFSMLGFGLYTVVSAAATILLLYWGIKFGLVAVPIAAGVTAASAVFFWPVVAAIALCAIIWTAIAIVKLYQHRAAAKKAQEPRLINNGDQKSGHSVEWSDNSPLYVQQSMHQKINSKHHDTVAHGSLSELEDILENNGADAAAIILLLTEDDCGIFRSAKIGTDPDHKLFKLLEKVNELPEDAARQALDFILPSNNNLVLDWLNNLRCDSRLHRDDSLFDSYVRLLESGNFRNALVRLKIEGNLHHMVVGVELDALVKHLKSSKLQGTVFSNTVLHRRHASASESFDDESYFAETISDHDKFLDSDSEIGDLDSDSEIERGATASSRTHTPA